MAAQPRRNSLTDGYVQAQQVQAGQQQMNLQQMQMDAAANAAARDTETRNALRGAVGPDGSLDYDAMERAYIGAGDAEGAFKVRGQKVKEGENRNKAATAEIELGMKRMELEGRLLSGVRDPQSYEMARQQAAAQGLDVSDWPAEFDAGLIDQAVRATMDPKARYDIAAREAQARATQANADRTYGLGVERNSIARMRAERPPGNGMSVSFDEYGNPVVQVGGAGPAAPGNMGLTKPNQNELQRDVIGGMGTLARLDEIANSYKSDYLTAQGAVKGWTGRMADKLGMASDDQKAFIQGQRKFTQQVDQEFNAYRKDITGAAAAMAELRDLKKAMINTDLSPAEFEAAYMAYRDSVARMLRIRQGILREGVPVGSREFNKRLDNTWVSGGDDDIEARGDELAASGMSEAQVKAQLRTEGYRF